MGEPIIVKLHGCSGAGKTTIARTIIALANSVHIVARESQPNVHEAYVCELQYFDRPIAVLGSYQNTCGGMDTVHSARDAMNLIDFYATNCHVFHEGLLQSTYYGALGEHSKKYGDRYVYAFLMPPVDVCLKRVEERRAVSARYNKFNPQLTIDKWNTINRLRNRVKHMGHNVYDWSEELSVEAQLRSLYLKEGQ